jgi:hypothetical protein
MGTDGFHGEPPRISRNLDKLEGLVVAWMFEMTKMNIHKLVRDIFIVLNMY